MAADVRQIMLRQSALERAKDPWNAQFQLQGEYINLKRTNFTGTSLTTEFLNGQMFDTTATEAMETGASTLLAWLWPNGGRSFSIVPAPAFEDDQDAKEWFGFATQTLQQLMDDDRAALATALGEVFEDAYSPCTGFLAALDVGDTNPDNPLVYEVWGLDECYIWRGRGGRVLGLHRKRLLEIGEYVDEYGIENVPKWVAEAYNANRLNETAKVIIAISLRSERSKVKKGAADMPWQSVHIDEKTRKVLKESGFQEFPIMTLCLGRKSNEAYGRFYGFKALPAAMELNAIWEAVTLALEKQLDPPLVVLDNGTMGGGTVDTSPGAINTVRVQGRAGQMDSPIKPLYEGGTIQGAELLIQELTKQLYTFAKLDRLLNTNDDKEMTLGESQLRDSRSTMALNTAVTRAVNDLFTPLIDRSLAVALRRGKLGYARGTVEAKLAEARGEDVRYIPNSILEASEKGIQAYTIRFLSPAARLAYAAEAQGIRQTMQDAAGMEPAFPGTLDRLDSEFALNRLNEINGGPTKLFLSAEKVKARQAAKAADAQAAAAAQAGMVGADAAVKEAQARKINNEANNIA